MNSDGKPQGLHLKPHKGTHLGSFYSLDSALPEEPYPKSLARRDLPDNAQKRSRSPTAALNRRQLPGELCARRPRNIPSGNSCHEQPCFLEMKNSRIWHIGDCINRPKQPYSSTTNIFSNISDLRFARQGREMRGNHVKKKAELAEKPTSPMLKD
ncbi:hypothetical protein EV2_039488 [Malus domestica]